MFCPQCGQRQIAEDSFFCLGCGWRLKTGGETFARVVPGVNPTPRATGRVLSPRQKGVRQGVMMMLSTPLVVPLMAILGTVMLGLPVEFVPASAVICIVGGLLRIIYAVMLQENTGQQAAVPKVPLFVPAQAGQHKSLSNGGARSPFASQAPAPGRWRDSHASEFQQPGSVTENTTRLLQYMPTRAAGDAR